MRHGLGGTGRGLCGGDSEKNLRFLAKSSLLDPVPEKSERIMRIVKGSPHVKQVRRNQLPSM
jgi:hypothetical protein